MFSHLMGIFYRTLRMLDNGIKPCYVFDGKPPQMKSDEVGLLISLSRLFLSNLVISSANMDSFSWPNEELKEQRLQRLSQQLWKQATKRISTSLAAELSRLPKRY